MYSLGKPNYLTDDEEQLTSPGQGVKLENVRDRYFGLDVLPAARVMFLPAKLYAMLTHMVDGLSEYSKEVVACLLM